MSVEVLVCLAPGSEEIEAVTVMDLLVRAGIKVTSASAADNGELVLTGSRGIKLVADVPLVAVAEQDFAAIVLPGGLKGAECFRDSPLLVEKVRHMHAQGRIVAAICAAPALVLQHHQLFPQANITGYPGSNIAGSTEQWLDRRVLFDARVNLLTSQGPGTAMEFSLRLIDLLLGQAAAATVAAQLILHPSIHNYQPGREQS